MKKKTVLIIFIVNMLVAALAIGGFKIWHRMNDYDWVLEANWHLTLPKEAKCHEIFEQNDEPSFHGDGFRYHVFSYQDEATIETWLPWKEEEGTTKFHGLYAQSAEAWLDAIFVPAEQRPRYEGSVYWYEKQDDNSEILVIWNRDEQLLYIVESFL